MPGHDTFDSSTAANPLVSKRCGSEMKARQNLKIREIGNALRTTGFLALDEQADALGLSRSTTWTILRGRHKGSGLSSAIINRMLRTPQLPPMVRAKINEYVQEKTAGLYGHNSIRLRKFEARLTSPTLTNASEETDRNANKPPVTIATAGRIERRIRHR
jgi:predicted DNA-binding transcriptional regulator AlpA